jgi:hypothetical protein
VNVRALIAHTHSGPDKRLRQLELRMLEREASPSAAPGTPSSATTASCSSPTARSCTYSASTTRPWT